MSRFQKVSLFLLRISMGWLMFYSGFSKILNPEWSASGFLKGAKTFPVLYQWFALPQNIGWVDFLNKWGELLIGTSLFLGLLASLASFFGIILMTLYYFPTLNFPYAGRFGLIVDDRIIYILVFLILIVFRAGCWFGLDKFLHIFSNMVKYSKLGSRISTRFSERKSNIAKRVEISLPGKVEQFKQ